MGLDRELDGLLVVSLEQAFAAPYCGLLLADAGARVIKVERPEGDFARGYDTAADGESVIFAWLNKGKESIALNLKEPADLATMRAMLARADIFLSNLGPGSVDAMGLDGPNLRQTNPGLITAQITGYGKTGRAADMKGYDALVQAEAAICAVTGTPETPSRVGVAVTDLGTGLNTFSAILRALIQRGRTGQGIDLDISMFDCTANWMNVPLLTHRYMGGAPARSGLQHGFVAPYNAYTCQGGDLVMLSIQNDREWAQLCEQVLGRPELSHDPRFATNAARFSNVTEVDALINAAFATKPRETVTQALDAARVANSSLNSVADLDAHFCLARDQSRIGNTPVEVVGLPVKSAGPRLEGAPALGQHTDAIKTEFAS